MAEPRGNKIVSDDQILKAFDETDGPFVTAGELAEILPIGRHGVRKRLEDLHQRGHIGRKQPVPQMIGWWKRDVTSDAPESKETAD